MSIPTATGDGLGVGRGFEGLDVSTIDSTAATGIPVGGATTTGTFATTVSSWLLSTDSWSSLLGSVSVSLPLLLLLLLLSAIDSDETLSVSVSSTVTSVDVPSSAASTALPVGFLVAFGSGEGFRVGANGSYTVGLRVGRGACPSGPGSGPGSGPAGSGSGLGLGVTTG